MASVPPLRVLAALGDSPIAGWQRQVLSRLVAVDGIVVETVAPSDVADRLRMPAQPDAIVDFAGIDCGNAARFGVWRYGFGDGSPFAAGAAGTMARLYRIGPDHSRATVLHEGWFRAASHETRGTAAVGDRVAPWASRIIRQLIGGDMQALERPPESTSGCRDLQPIFDTRSRVTAIRQSVQRWRRRERWTIGVVPISLEEILQRGRLPEPAWIRRGADDGFYADPFLVAADDDVVDLIVEDYRDDRRRGALARLRVSCDGRLLSARGCHVGRHHVSYPFVLRDRDRVFCIPEAAETRRVSAFPVAAEGAAELRTIMDGFAAVDPTLVRHDGRWWLFCTDRDDEDQTDLHVFFADDWRGPWWPHVHNPVKSDARSSRPAGAFFRIDGTLYRPAQNCAHRYGAALSINRILELSPQRFREEPVLSLAPAETWAWADGVHTINSIGGVTVVDGLRVQRTFGGANEP
jgi:hypothetical protein